MSGPIVRLGTSQKLADGWDAVFGPGAGKKSPAKAAKKAPKKAAKKPAKKAPKKK